jgi:hypothetical protein
MSPTLGAQDVIHPEMEGGLQIVRHTLLRLGYPLAEVQKYADVVRRESYDAEVNTDEERDALHGLREAAEEPGAGSAEEEAAGGAEEQGAARPETEGAKSADHGR